MKLKNNINNDKEKDKEIYKKTESDIDSYYTRVEELINELNDIMNKIEKKKFLELKKENEQLTLKIKDLEKEKNAHENNLNHLNEVVEENIKKTNYLENLVNTNGKKSEKIAEKAGLNTKI